MSDNYLVQATPVNFVIAMLLSSKSSKMMRSILRNRVNKRNLSRNINLSQTLKRLELKGLVKIENDEVIFSHNKLKTYKRYSFTKEEPKKERKVLMIFDIPETNRKTRDWLRAQIKIWGFKMIQKSVWLGNGPLPKEFDIKIKYLGVDKNIRIFNIQSSKK